MRWSADPLLHRGGFRQKAANSWLSCREIQMAHIVSNDRRLRPIGIAKHHNVNPLLRHANHVRDESTDGTAMSKSAMVAVAGIRKPTVTIVTFILGKHLLQSFRPHEPIRV